MIRWWPAKLQLLSLILLGVLVVAAADRRRRLVSRSEPAEGRSRSVTRAEAQGVTPAFEGFFGRESRAEQGL